MCFMFLFGKQTRGSPISFLVFLHMKFIVKLVSIQHPVLIPTGALCNPHHLPPRTPHQLSVCSQFLRVSYGLVPSLIFFFSPSPPPWSSVKFLRIHIRVKTYGICLSLYGLFHLASHSQFHPCCYKGPYFILSHCHVVLHCVYKLQFLYPFIS